MNNQKSKKPERRTFFEIFSVIDDNKLKPKEKITILGVTIGPEVSISRGVSFGGINLFDLYGKDLALVKTKEGPREIIGFYKDS